MRMQSGLLAIVTLLIIPCYQVSAANNVGYNMDEATKIMEAEYQRQLHHNKQYEQRKLQAQRKQHHVTKNVTKTAVRKVVRPQRQVAAQPQQRKVTPARVYHKPRPPVSPPQHAPSPVVPDAEDLFMAATNGSVATIGRLLSQGVNINSSNRERETALHMAAARGQYSAVIYLINHGANIHARTIKNWTPLHHAVRFRHANIANYLMKRGSQVYAKTSDGMSAIDMARTSGDHRMMNMLGVR